MTLTTFQQTFKNALLTITDDINFIYAHYLSARVDEVRQEIIDGILRGIITTKDDVRDVTKKMSPSIRKKTWQKFYSGDKSVKLGEFERVFCDAILQVENDVEFAYRQYYLAGNDEIRQRIIKDIENGILKTKADIEELVDEITPMRLR